MWANVDADRWVMEQGDGSTNYLRHSPGRLLELHDTPGAGATLHEYRCGEAPDPDHPLAAAQWESTKRVDLSDGADPWPFLSGLAKT